MEVGSFTQWEFDWVERPIQKIWKTGDENIWESIRGRFLNLVSSPLPFIAGVCDGVLGLRSILMAGTVEKLNAATDLYFMMFRRGMSRSFIKLTYVFYPAARRREKKQPPKNFQDGILHTYVLFYVANQLKNEGERGKGFRQHVLLRAWTLLALVVFPITRILDMILAVGAVIGSVCSLGKWYDATMWAYNGLRIHAIIPDTLERIRELINPWSIQWLHHYEARPYRA